MNGRVGLLRRHLSCDFVKVSSKIKDKEYASRHLQNLLDLEDVHQQWKKAGYHYRSPSHIQKYGTASRTALGRHFKIYSHLLDNVEYRMSVLDVQYSDVISAEYGNIIQPEHAQNKPKVGWECSSKDDTFTLLLVSPDSHPHDTKSNLLLWMVANIPGNLLENGDTVAEYVPPVPYKGTGFHRYVFLLLQQSAPQTPHHLRSVEERTINLPSFISEHNLHPYALSFYQSAWDATVGPSLARHLDCDEKQYGVERVKDIHEHYAEEEFMFKEWRMRNQFL